MSRSVIKLALVLAVLYCGTLATSPIVAQVAGNEANFRNSAQTATLDCVG